MKNFSLFSLSIFTFLATHNTVPCCNVEYVVDGEIFVTYFCYLFEKIQRILSGKGPSDYDSDDDDAIVNQQYLLRIPRVAHLNTSINLDLWPNPTLIHYWHVTIADYGHRLPQCLSLVINGKLWQINGNIKHRINFKRSAIKLYRLILP